MMLLTKPAAANECALKRPTMMVSASPCMMVPNCPTMMGMPNVAKARMCLPYVIA